MKTAKLNGSRLHLALTRQSTGCQILRAFGTPYLPPVFAALGSIRVSLMARGGRPRKYEPIADDISFAIAEMNNEEVKSLVSKSSIEVTDGEGRTPLIYAALSGNTEILNWLIELKADVNSQDRNGWCALHAASQNKHPEIIQSLINNGANPNLTDSFGNGPLWTATMNARGDQTIPQMLLQAGANANHKNNSNRSPNDMVAIMTKNLKLMAEQNAKNKA